MINKMNKKKIMMTIIIIYDRVLSFASFLVSVDAGCLTFLANYCVLR